MFGYIKPYKPEMKVSEFDTFQAIYCGLCKQLSHGYSPLSSLTLSYDFTFISTIALGLSDECTGFEKKCCVGNPLKRKNCHASSKELTFCAGCAMLMMYYKVLDNLHDGGFFEKLGCFCVLPFASYARRRAKKQYPNIDLVIKEAMAKQSAVEKSENLSLDRAADPTANALGLICRELTETDSQKQILYRFGYLVGRYVYFTDALDDLEEDAKTKSYNAFLNHFKNTDKPMSEIKEFARGVINVTVGEIAPAYELLALKRYKPILDNIIYLGLHDTLDKLEQKEKAVG